MVSRTSAVFSFTLKIQENFIEVTQNATLIENYRIFQGMSILTLSILRVQVDTR